MLRSKKYIDYTDDEILELSQRKLPDRDMYFVLQEIDHRRLGAELEQARKESKKRTLRESWGKHPVLKLVFLIFMVGFFIRRFMGAF